MRPTSETVIGEFMAKWIQSYRDLPLLLNQWANVVRWELRPRLFLRTSEFLWQEGHTAHATDDDAHAYAVRILHEVYEDFMVERARDARGRRARRPRGSASPAPTNTLTCEGMMGDGKALQMGTSHELGQNFARAFGIEFLDDTGAQQTAWTTSWGVSTRMVGGLIMAHGDDDGLRVPPRLAPVQVVVLVVRDEGDVVARCRAITDELVGAGVRAQLDARADVSIGPARHRLGAQGCARAARGRSPRSRRRRGHPRPAHHRRRGAQGRGPARRRRRRGHRRARPPAGLRCSPRRPTLRESRTVDVVHARRRAGRRGDGLGAHPVGRGRAPTAKPSSRRAASAVRCLTRADGSLPDADDEPDLVAVVARSY